MDKITLEAFKLRRQIFLSKIGSNSVALVPAAEEKIRNSHTEYLYRQNSDFMYLTGFCEPDSLLAFVPDQKDGEVILFCKPKDKLAEIWSGKRLGPAKAIKALGVDKAYSIEDLPKILPELIDNTKKLFYSFDLNKSFDQQMITCLQQLRKNERFGKKAPESVVDIDTILHEMRVIKSQEEIDIMQKACNISVNAHLRAIERCHQGLFEYQLEAELIHEFMSNGAKTPAYNSIVASGDNACILHYTENESQIQDGDLVLIDAGCELNGYASDITRTFPANGRFSAVQKAVYDIVLKTQLAVIDAIAPGKSWGMMQEITTKMLTEGLVSLGLLSGDIDKLVKEQAFKPFYMHGCSHFLGLDVHDVGKLKNGNDWRILKPGMVLTVEPGIYIAPDNDNVDAKWRGIGVRIEDDVLVTDKKCKVLTERLPKTTEAIESLMKST